MNFKLGYKSESRYFLGSCLSTFAATYILINIYFLYLILYIHFDNHKNHTLKEKKTHDVILGRSVI